jgi:hypothetical protein
MVSLAHLSCLRSRFGRLAFAATALSTMTVTVAGHPTMASAAVSLSCRDGDYRTPADKLPRPGVVTVHRWIYSPTTYWLNTLNERGNLSWIFIPGLNSETRVVSVWENGTSCYGTEYSRNAWAVTPSGRVYNSGSDLSGPPARNFGDTRDKRLRSPIVDMSVTPTGQGYWLVGSDGGIFTFGDARFYGSTGAKRLRSPIVGMAVTPNGRGYWLVAADGGIFTFGDARFYGSTGAIRLRSPIVGMAVTQNAQGYWLVASDGGIFTFGNARFRGSLGAKTLPSPIAGIISRGPGYTLIAENGDLYPFRAS